MCTNPGSWFAYFMASVDVFITIAYFLGEHVIAWAVPWWRRYGSVFFFCLKIAIFREPGLGGSGARLFLGIAAVVVFNWNWRTFWDRRNKGDRKPEKAPAQITEAQQVAFQREAEGAV